jgi:hypothetical protein
MFNPVPAAIAILLAFALIVPIVTLLYLVDSFKILDSSPILSVK